MTVCGNDPRVQLSAHDLAEVESFRRFLKVCGAPPFTREDAMRIPGWLPYVLGVGPAPPTGMDGLPVTAWTAPA
jgi:hypothetical protein